jgi:hypothetical protein
MSNVPEGAAVRWSVALAKELWEWVEKSPSARITLGSAEADDPDAS